MQIEQRVEKSIGWPGDVPPLSSRNFAQILRKEFSCDVRSWYRDRKSTFSNHVFTTTGISGIFSHLKELPGIVIISFYFSIFCPPTGGETKSSPRTTCVEYTQNIYFSFFASRK